MGFVRMIRSGSLHSVSNAVKFVPPEFAAAAGGDSNPNLEELARSGKDSSFTAETVEAAKLVDLVVKNMAKTFAEEGDFFQVSQGSCP